MDPIRDDLDCYRTTNAERLRKLAEKGFSVSNASALFVEAALEILLGDRLDEARLLAERRLADQLDQVERQVQADLARRALLAPPAPPIVGGKR